MQKPKKRGVRNILRRVSINKPTKFGKYIDYNKLCCNPQLVDSLSDYIIIAIACRSNHSLALSNQGKVYCNYIECFQI